MVTTVRESNSKLANMAQSFVIHILLAIVFTLASAGVSHYKCPVNSEYRECGSYCEPTCDTRDVEKRVCPKIKCTKATEGCHCIDGYYRNTDSGECVPYDDCPCETTTTTQKPVPEPNCSCNETMTLCGRHCEPTCANRDSKIQACPKLKCGKHTEGCRCNDGLYRDTESGECVSYDDCPCEVTTTTEKPTTKKPITHKPTTKKPITHKPITKKPITHKPITKKPITHKPTTVKPVPKPVCSCNETMNLCGRHCEKTCADRDSDVIACTKMMCGKHTEGCRCNDGYYRDTESGQCVLYDDCPCEVTTTTEKATTQKPMPENNCPCNESMDLCGRNCEATCDNMNPNDKYCSKIKCTKHTKGCRCDKGYYRNTDTMECVQHDECPKPKPKCGENEELGPCGRLCEGTCKNPDNKKCHVAKCSEQSCRCKSGYVRNEETDKCILAKKCPMQCKTGEIYTVCGRKCEGTCESPVIPHICSKMSCSTDKSCLCDTANGWVRNKDTDECIPAKDCPKEECDE